MNALKKVLFFVPLFIALAGCSATQPLSCVASANGYSAQPPCWISRTPTQGKVVIGNKHAGAEGWLTAKTSLLNRAMLELAKARFGQQVDAQSTVTTSTTVASIRGQTSSTKEQVWQHASDVVVAEIYTPTGGISVKAEIKDYYYYPPTEKIYLWVIEK